jgi:CelD/BcsL family acetyltransferase involved in cellulose biosynthesis
VGVDNEFLPAGDSISIDATRQARVFRGRQGLLALEGAWRILEQQLPALRFIHCYGWCRSYMESMSGDGETVVFIAIYVGDVVTGILPLRQTHERRFGMRLRTWEILWPNDMGICDFVFEQSAENRANLRAALTVLRAHKEFQWDLLHLQDTLEDSCVRFSLQAAPPPRTLSILHHYSKYVPCNGDYEHVMARVSGHFRRNVRRQVKKLNELGGIEYRFVSAPSELESAFNHFLTAEASSWKGEAGSASAIVLDKSKVAFYRNLMDEFAARGSCMINLILRDGQCIASQFGVLAGDTLYLLKIGYAEEYRNMGPGNVLLSELVRRCTADGKIKNISFITGASWNDNWSPVAIPVYDNLIFNATAKGIAAYLLESVKDRGRKIKHRLRRQENGSDAVRPGKGAGNAGNESSEPNG